MWESFVFDKYWKISIQWDTKGISKNDLEFFKSLVSNESIDFLNQDLREKNCSIKWYIEYYINEKLAELWDF